MQLGNGIIIRKCKIVGKGGKLSIGDSCNIDSVTFTFSGNDGIITIGKKCRLNDTRLGVYVPSGRIEIHNNVSLKCASLGIHGAHGVVDIHNNVTINANKFIDLTFADTIKYQNKNNYNYNLCSFKYLVSS